MTPSVRSAGGLLLAASLLALSACSDGGADDAQRAQSAGLAAATTAPSTSPFATPTATAVARSGEPQVSVLPESELARLDGYAYTPIKGAPELDPALRSLEKYFAGYVGRSLTRDGKVAGVVQLVRLQREAATDDDFIDGFLAGFLQEYAETDELGRGLIAGQRVRTVKDVRATDAGLVAWLEGRDLVLILAVDGLPDARRLARQYLNAP